MVTIMLIIIFFELLTNKNFYLAYCVPCLETCGMCFSRIHVTNSTGEAPTPLGQMNSKSHVKSMK